MENENTENGKKVRKPRLPKLQRKFVKVQDMLQEIQEDVALALKDAKTSRNIDPKDFDFTELSYAELLDIQIKLGAAIVAKSKEVGK